MYGASVPDGGLCVLQPVVAVALSLSDSWDDNGACWQSRTHLNTLSVEDLEAFPLRVTNLQ